MQTTFDRHPADDNWVVSLSIDSLNARELEQFAAFGGFIVDVGGAIVDGQVSYSLPVKEVIVPTDFPQKVLFSVESLTATVASAQAEAWETVMETRLQEALTEWLTFDPTTGTSRRTLTINPTP